MHSGTAGTERDSLFHCPSREFFLSLHVIFDNFIRRIQNILGGTVILFQPNHLCIRKYLFKSEDISYVSP